jgi:glycerophosphoryl diester phosphodiesterase
VAGLFQIGMSCRSGELIPVRKVLLQLLAELPDLFRFSLRTCLVCLIALLIFSSVPAILFLVFLTEHDINYYISTTPPEWYWVIGAAICWGSLCLWYAARVALRSLYLLPAWMSGIRPFGAAVQWSFDQTRGLMATHIKQIGPCVIFWMIAPLLVGGLLFIAFGILLEIMNLSVHGMLVTIFTYLLLSGILQTLLSFLGMALTVCVWILCYEKTTPATLPASGVERSAGIAEQRRGLLPSVFRPAMILPFGIAVVLLNLGFSVYVLDKQPPEIKTLVIAHRTGPLEAPENTLSGMQIVLQQGAADVIELDVQLTSDGHVVGVHDADLMKLAGDPHKISGTPYAELAGIDIGKKFGSKFVGEKIGLLSQFLALSKGSGVPLIIEFKFAQGKSELIQKTIELVRQYEMEKDVILMSLEMSDVRFVQSIAPDILSGYFASIEMGDLAALDVEVLAPSSQIATPELVRKLSARGIAVYVWTLDDPMHMVELIEMGVDGIITNEPLTARKVINKLQSFNSLQRGLLKFRQFWKVFDELKIWETAPEPGA